MSFGKAGTLGSLGLSNRIALAPMSRARADFNGVPTDMMGEFYRKRNTAGLLITEATAISGIAYGYRGMPGIFNRQQIDGWRKLLRDQGHNAPPMILQLQHCGRVTHSSFLSDGRKPISASAQAIEGEYLHQGDLKLRFEMPEIATEKILSAVLEEYRRAASAACRVGFAGIEINCGFGNLLDSFLQKITNQRHDRYGGSLQNRLRFPLMVLDAVIHEAPEACVGLRVSPNVAVNDMEPFPTAHEPEGLPPFQRQVSLKRSVLGSSEDDDRETVLPTPAIPG